MTFLCQPTYEMPSSSRAIIAAAGTRKTQLIVDRALQDHDGRVLVTTYTNENMRRISRRIVSRNRVVPADVHLVPWMTFLLRDGVKPYQSVIFKTPGVVRGVDFESRSPRYVKRPKRGYYLNTAGNVYGDVLSDLAYHANRASSGEVIERLEAIYTHIYIDEVQDIVGWDLEFLDLLLRSRIAVTVVGDPRQHMLKTNLGSKNKAFRGVKFLDWLDRRKEYCETQISVDSYRCNQLICDFASGLFPGMTPLRSVADERCGHDGVHRIERSEVAEYVAQHAPLVLRHDRRTRTDDLSATNIGLAKGSTCDHVLIFTTKPMRDYLTHRDPSKLKVPEELYVAVTRARFSVAFVD